LPVDVVKELALTSGQDPKPWVAWAERDPKALTVALAVGETDRPAVPVSAYDFGAGYLIGKTGDESAIRQRLSGLYSEPLVSGLAYGLSVGRIAPYVDALVARFERFSNPLTFQWLNDLLREVPEQVKPHLQRYIDNPTPPNLTRLQALPDLWRKADRDYDLTLKALQSDSVELRKFALERIRWNLARARAKQLLPPILLAALEGRNANADADEQRLALLACNYLFETNTSNISYFKRAAGIPIPPLTPAERVAIAAFIQQLRPVQPQATPVSQPSR
jgi:hypothetical protein